MFATKKWVEGFIKSVIYDTGEMRRLFERVGKLEVNIRPAIECTTCSCLIYKKPENKGESRIERERIFVWEDGVGGVYKNAGKEIIQEHYYCKKCKKK